jgi:hypothetical protein
MLQDLSEVIAEVRARIDQIPLDVPFYPSGDLWDTIVSCYSQVTSDNVDVVGDTLVITTPLGNFLTISAQEIPRIWAILPYARALCDYGDKLKLLANALGYAAPSSGRAKNEIFKKLPRERWREELDNADVEAIRAAVNERLNLTEREKELFLKFLENSEWSGVSKTLERSDWRQAAIAIAGRWLAVAAERRGELALALRQSDEFETMMAEEISRAVVEPPRQRDTPHQTLLSDQQGGRNELIYGAPGTGKSYSVDEELKGRCVVRTVFHPDMQNSDFFGSLKPKMVNEKVAYAFSPGPFSNALRQAYEKPDQHHYLVIEELNRAPAAAVFGELFQLLDRDDSGESRYEVDVPSEDAQAWFGRSKLKLPANLSILATMNSADQGVFPLDTAFRRRWSEKYFPLYGDTSKFPHGDVNLAANDGGLVLEWRQFVRCLNEKLIELGVAEDRLMGIWFARENELNGPIPMKVLLYLWDDVLRHQDRNAIFNSKLRTFGEINSAILAGKPILADDLLSYMKGFAEQATDTKDQAEGEAEDAVASTEAKGGAAVIHVTSDDEA